ncbi:MAG: peroxiredoxin [Magnetococcales bacterium]|nr:peroxiredoxin [Magnetococcales bacterium]
MLQIGDTIPDLMAPDHSGHHRYLHKLLGTAGGVIYFYPRDNTPGCTLEAQDFQLHGEKFAALGYTIVGISRDSVASHANFCAKFNLSFTLLSDEDGRLCNSFGVWQEKKNYGKVSMGIVRSTFVTNGQGVVTRVYHKVKTDGHAERVLLDLQQT